MKQTYKLPYWKGTGVSGYLDYALGRRRLEWVIRIPVAPLVRLATWFCLWLHRYFWPFPAPLRRLIEDLQWKARFTMKPVGVAALAMAGAAMFISPYILGLVRKKAG